MTSSSDTLDYFSVMGLDSTATESEIKKKFKKLSLILHPDKNPNQDPIIAATRFHELKLAYEVLMDPSSRLAAQEKLKTENARKERRGAYEGKRREMAEDLERRETEDRNKRMKFKDEELERKKTLDRLKEEGRKLREEKDRKKEEEFQKIEKEKGKQRELEMEKEKNDQDRPPPLGPLDLSLLLKFPSSQYEYLSTPSNANPTSSSSFPTSTSDPNLTTPLYHSLSTYGPISSILFIPPKTKLKTKKDGSQIQTLSKEASAHVTFERLDSAYAVVMKGNQMALEEKGLEDVWVGWANGKGKGKVGEGEGEEEGLEGEPERIKWLRRKGRLGVGNGNRIGKVDLEMIGDEETSRNQKEKLGSDSNGGIDLGKVSSGINGDSKSNPAFSFNPTSTPPKPPTFSFSNPNQTATQASLDYESATLLRLREAERKRVEEEIQMKEREEEDNRND